MDESYHNPKMDDPEDKPWNFAEPYHTSYFSKERSTGADAEDPWMSILDFFKSKERDRCDVWKDEVQNLLVFAGLFSAVVTALLAESYKELQPDPKEILLAQILVQLGSISNSSIPTSLVSSFAPSRASRCVNTLWFLSLVFSLGAALIGIICLQWLREHLRSSTYKIPPRLEAPLLDMQGEALQRYMVPHMFSTLPLLILIALILFLAGLVDFLWDIDKAVAIPVLVLISFIFAFILITTVLPGLQFQPLRRSGKKRKGSPRAPCPYKSPQSWAFLRLSAMVRFFYLHRIKPHLPFLMTFREASLAFQQQVAFFRTVAADVHDGWIARDIIATTQRDIDFLESKDDLDGLSEIIYNPGVGFTPVHDSVRALMHVKESLSIGGSDRTRLAKLYQCFQELTDFQYEDDFENKRALATYVHDHLLPAQPQALSNEFIEGQRLRVLQDNARLRFMLYAAPEYHSRTRALTERHIEMCVRLSRLSYLPIRFDESPLCQPIDLLINACGYGASQFDHTFRVTLALQALDVLREVFERTHEDPPKDSDVGKTSLSSHYIYWFMSAIIISHSNVSLDPRVISSHDAFCDSLIDKITQPSPEISDGADFTFYIATSYSSQLAGTECFSPSAAFDKLTHTLKTYDSSSASDYLRWLKESGIFEPWMKEQMQRFLDRLDVGTPTLQPRGKTSASASLIPTEQTATQ